MERGDHPPDDQQPRRPLPHLVLQLRRGDHPFYDRDPGNPGAPHDQAGQADEGDAGHPAQAQGHPGQVQERPAEGVPGDDEALQRAGCEPVGLSGTNIHTVPHLDWPLPGGDPDPAIYPRAPGDPFQQVLLGPFTRARGRPAERALSVDGSGVAGPFADHPAPPCRGVDVRIAKDDDDAVGVPAAGLYESHAAVDDAGDVRILHVEFPKRPGGLLGGFQRDRSGDTRFCHRLGSAEKPV